MINVTASLTTKKNNYYVVTYYRDIFNKIHRKTHKTGIKAIKGNKKQAERKKEEIRNELEKTVNSIKDLSSFEKNNTEIIKFCDYMVMWLETIKPTIVETTYAGYYRIIHGKIYNYFYKLGVTLQELKPYHIQNFYNELYKLGLKSNTILHYHANIRKALQQAVKKELIPSNPADKIDKPKSEKFIGNFYTKTEFKKLFTLIKNTPIKIPVLLASYYGLRRSEVLGLKWNSVDFETKSIIIRHTVSQTKINNKLQIIAKDKTKNKSSYRSLPLIPEIEHILLEELERQSKDKEIFGNEYKNKDGYICVNNDGSLLKPDYVSHKFHQIIKDNNLKNVRFHDLRHSCASLLLHNKVQMKDIQAWLGHSNYSTTADLYAHIDITSKTESANVISNALNF